MEQGGKEAPMELRERLTAHITGRRGGLAEVARRAGLDHVTVRKIALGQTLNPGINTVRAIEAALDQVEALDEARDAKGVD
jgi:DNA-binding phage protein